MTVKQYLIETIAFTSTLFVVYLIYRFHDQLTSEDLKNFSVTILSLLIGAPLVLSRRHAYQNRP